MGGDTRDNGFTGAVKVAESKDPKSVLALGRTRLYLARHGELTTSSEWRYVGHMDIELNESGESQMRALGQQLQSEHIDIVFSSDLKRTVRSAELVAEQFDLEVSPCSAFREINLGHWEGLTMQEIVERFKEEFEERASRLAEFRVQDGESFVDVRDRAIPKLRDLLKQYEGKNILLVAHGGVNRVILCDALGLTLEHIPRIEQNYACLNIIDYYDGQPVVKLMNAYGYDV